VEDERQVENDRQRAEVFDALGHPTRIVILKALSEGPLGFADLKKKTAIESSGHLQHHLTKLNGLIKTDDYGKYCLSDQGKDALLTVQTVENTTPKSNGEKGNRPKTNGHHFNSKLGLKPSAFLLVALLIASSAIALFEYNQAADLRKENSFLNGVNSDATAYYNEFGAVVPITNVNSSFAPPISMYHALLIGLNADGWNKTTLQGMTIHASLMPWQTVTDSAAYNKDLKLPMNLNIRTMTNPPASYSDTYGNGVIYEYVWQIDIGVSGVLQMPPPGFILIDASTGQILPNPILG
jgi:DNA-binding HxlR family transcriptional regulator